MIVLSELKCDTATRCICLYNSFGIVTILQQEILQGYKYIAGNEIPPQAEKRLCNALTIIRSLVSSPDLASRFLNCGHYGDISHDTSLYSVLYWTVDWIREPSFREHSQAVFGCVFGGVDAQGQEWRCDGIIFFSTVDGGYVCESVPYFSVLECF